MSSTDKPHIQLSSRAPISDEIIGLPIIKKHEIPAYFVGNFNGPLCVDMICCNAILQYCTTKRINQDFPGRFLILNSICNFNIIFLVFPYHVNHNLVNSKFMVTKNHTIPIN